MRTFKTNLTNCKPKYLIESLSDYLYYHNLQLQYDQLMAYAAC